MSSDSIITEEIVSKVLNSVNKLIKRRDTKKFRVRKRQKRKSAFRKQRWDIFNNYKENDGDYRIYDDGAMKMGAYVDEEAMSLTDERGEYFLAGTSINDHYISKLIDSRTSLNKNTFHKEQDVVCTNAEWLQYSRDKESIGWQVIEFGELAGMIIDSKEVSFLDYSVSSNSVTIKLYGDKDWVEKIHRELLDNFTIAKCQIEWIYSSDGSSINIPLLGDKLPISEMYPFLENESVEEYYDRYLASDASILLLIGPPGTGKTTFIRGLLHHTGKNAIVTYDEAILQKDYVFSRFIEDDVSVMVLEDSDNFLKPRNDGNSMMHRFLNVGDGLITVKGKKLIFSTNLPSIKNIDPALVRPGRCFDIVNFSNYTEKQAKALAEKLGIKFTQKENQKDYSLAEIFHQQRSAAKVNTHKFGFI